MTMTMIDTMLARWRESFATPTERKFEVDPDHPLRLIFGADRFGDALFFCISDAKPGLPELSDAVSVERGVRAIDGKWTLSLTLQDPRLLGVFMRLCEDLAHRTAGANSEAQAMRWLLDGVAEWKHLLRTPPADGITIEVIRGLVAELWFARWLLSQARCSVEELVLSWTGPQGFAQDFIFADGPSYEVKSVHPDAQCVRISSAEQLDPGNLDLSLEIVTLIEATPETTDAVSVRSLYAELEQAAESAGFVDKLRTRIQDLGVDPTDAVYDSNWFVATQKRSFEVNPAFPSIRASKLPSGVDEVTYSITFAAIRSFETSRESFR
jgi:hypothetical protein